MSRHSNKFARKSDVEVDMIFSSNNRNGDYRQYDDTHHSKQEHCRVQENRRCRVLESDKSYQYSDSLSLPVCSRNEEKTFSVDPTIPVVRAPCFVNGSFVSVLDVLKNEKAISRSAFNGRLAVAMCCHPTESTRMF